MEEGTHTLTANRYTGIEIELGGDMMPGSWLARDANLCVIGSGVIGMGEQWNGDKKDVRSFKVSPDVYGAIVKQSISP